MTRQLPPPQCTAPPPPPPPPPEVKEATGDPLPRQATNAAKSAGLSVGGGLRKKAANSGVKPWLLLESTGQSQVVEVGKHDIMRRTGLPARDLRILDPFLSYPSTILGRERAIVINLEHIKAIITAQEVLILNSRDLIVAPFVKELEERISRHGQAIGAQEAGNDDVNAESENLCEMGEPQTGKVERKAEEKQQIVENRDRSKFLPFEFVVFEACLEATCSCLDTEARTLEQEAHPALDKLTTKISTLNLERVRQIKSRLVGITGRVQKVRDELENLLDDDEDMAEMYLTEKLEQQKLENFSTASLDEQDDMDEALQSKMDDRVPADISMEGDESSIISDGDIQQIDDGQEQFLEGHRGTHTTTHSSTRKNLDVEELEMLLEAYFIQIDGTLNNLSSLREYVDDTEDYINITLDDKQNHLLQMGVMLSTATLVVGAFVVVAGAFGMNIHISLFGNDDPPPIDNTDFMWTVGGSTAGIVFLYVISIAWYKYRRLVE